MKRFRHIFITVVILLILFSTLAYGDTWTPRKRLTWNTGSSDYPAIAVNGSNIYVVWQDNTLGNGEIYFMKSDDGGVTWSEHKNLSNNARVSRVPTIAVSGSNIYVVWSNGAWGTQEIYFKKSDDGGTTWSTSKRLTYTAGDSYFPAIAVDGSNIYVVWEDLTPGIREIYFKKSIDKGTTWTAAKNLSNSTGSSGEPAVAVDGSNIYVVWIEYSLVVDYDPEIYFKKTSDRGATWTTNKSLTNSAGIEGPYEPAIAVNGSNIYVVWSNDIIVDNGTYFKKSYDSCMHQVYPLEPTWNFEIYFKKSYNWGATWTTDKWLTINTGGSGEPAIAVDGQNVYVVWSEYYMSGGSGIYFKKSYNGGTTWTTDKQIANYTGYSYRPTIAVDNSNIYVVWSDNTPGNYEIYFKKGVLY